MIQARPHECGWGIGNGRKHQESSQESSMARHIEDEVAYSLPRSHLPYFGHSRLGKPEVVIRPSDNLCRTAIRCRKRKLGGNAAGSNTTNLVFTLLNKPQVAIRPGGNSTEQGTRCCYCKLGDGAAGSNTPNPVSFSLGKPEIVIRPNSNLSRTATRRW